ncbi:MAG: hypothetical protein GX596_09855 [Propionibacterium sp.]|nr:hypothetical protein [Propionibacterium sp.]
MAIHDDLQFSVPNDNWEPATPPEGQAFIAMRAGEFQHFRPSISVDVAELQPGATLEGAGEQMYQRLRELDDDASLVRRGGEDGMSTVVQRVEFGADVAEGTTISLVQLQFLTEVPESGGDRRVAMCFMLTAEAGTISEYADDFETFLTQFN